MTSNTTIYLRKTVVEQLKDLKVSPSESYNDVIERLIKYRGFTISNGMMVVTDALNIEIKTREGDVKCLDSLDISGNST